MSYNDRINYNYKFSQTPKLKKKSEDYIGCYFIFTKIKFKKKTYTTVKKYEQKIFLDFYFILLSLIATLLIQTQFCVSLLIEFFQSVQSSCHRIDDILLYLYFTEHLIE